MRTTASRACMRCCTGWGYRTWCPGPSTLTATPLPRRLLKNLLGEKLAQVQAQHPERTLQVWFQDEARFGQQGCNSRVWAKRGTRPRAARQIEYEWLYLFAAVCPASGQSNAWIMPVANTQTLQVQLDELSRNLQADHHMLLILDGAGWHKSHALRVPGNITLLHLPPYAPELNPAELLWRQLRQRYLSNRVYADLQELDQALGDAWIRLSEDPQCLRQLTNFDGIEAAVAAHQRSRQTLDTS